MCPPGRPGAILLSVHYIIGNTEDPCLSVPRNFGLALGGYFEAEISQRGPSLSAPRMLTPSLRRISGLMCQPRVLLSMHPDKFGGTSLGSNQFKVGQSTLGRSPFRSAQCTYLSKLARVESSVNSPSCRIPLGRLPVVESGSVPVVLRS